MSTILPQDLSDMRDVTLYWRQCLAELDTAADDREVASHMVGVVGNAHEQDWASNAATHPAYPLIFELAASLELPEAMTGQRSERWRCIEALMSVLERNIPGSNDRFMKI